MFFLFVSDLNTVAVQETQITFFQNLNASESVIDNKDNLYKIQGKANDQIYY